MNRKRLVIILLLVLGLLALFVVWKKDRQKGMTPEQQVLAKVNRILDEEKMSGQGGDAMVVASPTNLQTKYSLDSGAEDADGMILADICDRGLRPDVMEAKAALIRRQVDYLITGQDMDRYMTSIDCSFVKGISSYSIYRVNHNFYDTVSEEKKVQEILKQVGCNINQIEISLGDDRDTKGQVLGTYLLLNDLHVLLTTDDTTEEHHDTINQRYSDLAVTGEGVHSADMWQGISAVVDAMHVDGLLLAGDMIDFGSSTNFDIFQKGLDKIETPILYARSDHDMAAWYNSDGSYTKKDVKAAQKSLKGADDNLEPMDDIMVWDKEQYYIVAWNNSTKQLSEKGLAKAKAVFDTGKPIILMTHVPINSTVDDGLLQAAKDFDTQHRAKLWGKDCLYEPNEVTEEFIHMVVTDDSPVRAVLSGHLHFAYETKLNHHCMEYVCHPSYAGNITQVTIVR